MDIFSVLNNITQKYPDRTAVRHNKDSITYADLYSKSLQVSNYLLNVTQKSKQPIGILLESNIQSIVYIFGVIGSGHFYLPLDTSFPPERIKLFLQFSGCRHLLTIKSDIKKFRYHNKSLKLHDIVDVNKNSSFDEKGTRFKNLYDPVVLHFTSGSTGTPKGVIHSHHTLLFDIRRQTNDLKICHQDRIDLLFSMSFSASLAPIFSSILNGASLEIYDLKKEGVHHLNEWHIRNGITISTMSVSTFRHLLYILRDQKPSDSLRLISVGGENLIKEDIELFKKYFHKNCLLQNAYATTETRTVSQFFINHNTSITQKNVPLGKVVDSKKIRILGDHGKKLPKGHVGEISVQSIYHPTSYYRNEKASRKQFLIDKNSKTTIFLTGDLGKLDNDGILHFYGRKDGLVKIRGFWVNLLEIEKKLMEMRGIKEACVVTKEGKNSVLEIVVFWIPNSAKLKLRDVRECLQKSLPEYMWPKHYKVLDRIPLNPTGKKDRLYLMKYISENNDKQVHAKNKPNGDAFTIEDKLLRIWEEEFDKTNINVGQNFFDDLGGDSLSAVRILFRLEKEYNRQLPLTLIYRYRTIQSLSNYLKRETNSITSLELIRKGTGESQKAIIVVPPLRSNITIYDKFLPFTESAYSIYCLTYDLFEKSKDKFLPFEKIIESCVRDIQSIDKIEQFNFIGFSFGGIFAFEIAQRLNVPHKTNLFFIDTQVPDYGSLSLRDKMLMDIRKILNNFRNVNTVEFGLIREKLNRFLRTVRYNLNSRLGLNISPMERKDIDNLFHSAALRIITKIQLKPYNGRIILFRATDTSTSNTSNYSWDKYALRGIEIYDIKGTHSSILSDQNIVKITSIIKDYVEIN